MHCYAALLSFVTIIYFGATSPAAGVNDASIPPNLIGYLFNTTRYDKNVLPSLGTSAPLNVSVGLSILQIENLNEKEQVLISHVVITLEWHDYNLAWSPADYNGTEYISVSSKKIWTPDIVLYNSVQADNAAGLWMSNVFLHHTGLVKHSLPRILHSACKTNVVNYPFDKQQCELKFGSWAFHGFDIAVDNEEGGVDLTNYVKSGEWELESFATEQHIVIYGCCPEPYYDITYYINLRRQVLYYAMYFIIPCALIALLAATIFVLPEDCSERITVGMCALVGLSFFFLLVSENMPASSTVPLIGGYYSVTMIQMGFSFFMNILVLRFHHMTDEKMPDWVRKYILGYGSFFLRLKCSWKKGKTLKETDKERKDDETKDVDTAVVNAVVTRTKRSESLIMSDQSIAAALEEQAEATKRDIEWKKAAHVLNNMGFTLHLTVVFLTFTAMFFEVIFTSSS